MRRLDLDQKTMDAIGLSYVLDKVETASQFSKKALLACHYFTAEDRLARIAYFKSMKRLDEVMTSSKKVWNNSRNALSDLKDLSPVLKKLEASIRLDAADLFLLKQQVALQGKLLELREILVAGGIQLVDHTRVLTLLHGNRRKEDLYPIRLSLSDFDDAELASARKRLAALQLALADMKPPFIEAALSDLEEAEAIVTEREERHLLWLEESLQPFIESLYANQEKLVALDLQMSKLILTESYAPGIPRLSASRLLLQEAIQPEEASRLKNERHSFTPLDISLRPGLTLITGANMSGKSMALNTILLNALLVNMGFLPFAKGATVPLFASYVRIGDVEGDRSQGLSTFGSEVVELKAAAAQASKEKVLLLIDEPFRGTNPTEGRLLASGLSSFLAKQDSFSLLATHYRLADESRYRRYVSGDIHIPDETVSDEKDAIRLLSAHVDYRLKEGAETERQKAIEIAAWLGLQEEILTQVEDIKRREEVEHGNA